MNYKVKVFIASILLFSCAKEVSNIIPRIPVNIALYLTDPQMSNLQSIGGWEYLTGGSRGIIVFRKNISEFAAYDRHTPYNPELACAVVEVDSTEIFAVDRCSQSRFNLFDGSIAEGPADIPLVQYRTSYDQNQQILRIFN